MKIINFNKKVSKISKLTFLFQVITVVKNGSQFTK